MQIRLISYSSVDSFVPRDYNVLDIVRQEKANLKILTDQKLLNNNDEKKENNDATVKNGSSKTSDTKTKNPKSHSRLMNTKERVFSTPARFERRREYYNDFEICLRDCKNQKIKSLQKQTKVHLSDGDNNSDSDGNYVDCTEPSDLKTQSSLTSKSMPHVPSGTFKDNTFSGPLERSKATAINTDNDDTVKVKGPESAQLDICRDNNLKLKYEIQSPSKSSEQLTAYNNQKINRNNSSSNNSNQTINDRSNTSGTNNHNKVNPNEKSIRLSEKNKLQVNQNVIAVAQVVNKEAQLNELVKKPSAVVVDETCVKKDLHNQSRRRSSKKHDEIKSQDPSQGSMKMTSDSKISSIDDASWGPEREIVLERVHNKSFGISIVGGKVNVSGDSLVSGIFIKNVIAGSSADMCGRLKVGDRILAVDGIDIRDSSHDMAVKTIKNANDKMTLLVQSLNTGTSTHNQIDFMKKLPPPVTPSKTPQPELIQEGSEKDDIVKDDLIPIVELKKDPMKGLSNGVSSPEQQFIDVEKGSAEINSTGHTPVPETESEGSSDEDEEDVRDMEGKTYTAAGVEIDRSSAGNVKRSKEEITADPEKENNFGYTANKIKKRYGTLGTVLSCIIDRGTNTNIGISLAGHRDRTKMACFIAGINPKGIASSSSAGLEIGDEILEVNGIVLHGRCHLNASAIIKGLPGPMLQLIVLRRKQAIEDLAVKPVTQFPVEISNEDAFSSFKNVRHVTIKKGNQSLGIMIIEGKHAEVGQGIFVSDIQEGSNAEKAGLNIGDMLLAVNKDSLLGCNYETAANMLKKTEGVVVLTVCNPNKKDKEKDNEKGDNDAVTVGTISMAPGSRPVTPKPQASPAKEVVADPATCEIRTNDNTVIEIKLENQPLGVQVCGGSDSLVNNGAVIVNIIPDSIADKDKRLQVFDQILEINSTKMTSELTSELVQRSIKQVQSKVKMVIYRAEPSEIETIEVELTKKSGKNLGVGFFTKNPRGLLVTDICPGGIADLDGRIQKGDIVTHVNSENISNMSLDECSTLFKAIQGKIILKLLRAKPKKRNS